MDYSHLDFNVMKTYPYMISQRYDGKWWKTLSNNTHGRLGFFFFFLEIIQFRIDTLVICLFLLNWREAVSLYTLTLSCINWLATLIAVVIILSKACWLYSLNYSLCLQKHTLYNHLLLVDSMHTVCNIYCICQVFKRPLGVLINVS